MKFTRRLIFGLLFALGVVRLLAYLAYAATCLPSPLETAPLEAKMVLLAYRAEIGETLYPAWRDHPHVANFMGPAYFWAVGVLGAACRAEIRELFWIGRGIAFASGLLTSVVVGLVVRRRYGGVAGASAGVLSLGAAPMFWFSVMVRPDMTAELLGVGGFFLSGRKGLMGGLAGGGLLVLAVMTKQTAGVFLLATSLAWAIEGDWRRGVRLLLGCSALTLALVAVATLMIEPNFARSLGGESKLPWKLGSLVRNLERTCRFSPDLLFFPILGLGLWISGATGGCGARPAALAVVLLASSIVLAAKEGADLNYYLSLRVVEGMAVGAIWRAWSLSESLGKSAALASAALAGCLSMVPGISFATSRTIFERASAAYLAGPYGRDLLGFHRALFAMAGSPKSRLLTDSGHVDLHHGRRADFGDPWLFRMLADLGQVDLKVMRDRVDSQYYDLIVTTSELDRPGYESYSNGLPMPLVERARVRYVRIGIQGGLFLYGRRRSPRPVTE